MRPPPVASKALVAWASLWLLACGRTDLDDLATAGAREPERLGVEAGGTDGGGSVAPGWFGGDSDSGVLVEWCDAGPPRLEVIPGSTCGLYLTLPCGLPQDIAVEPSGLLSPELCGQLCPRVQLDWESCAVVDFDGSVAPGIEMVCVPECS